MKNIEKGLSERLSSPALDNVDKKGVAIVAATSTAMNLLLFAMPLYSLQVYDRVLVSRSSDTLIFLTLLVVFCLTASVLLDALRSRLLLRIGNAYALRLGPRLIDASIALSARQSESDVQVLRQMATVRGFITAPQGMATLFDAPLVPLFLIAVYLMHLGLGHAMLFGMLVLLVLTFVTEALSSRHLRAAGEE